MIHFLSALPLLIGLAQSPPPSESLERERVTGALGARLDSRLTRFAAYGFSGAVIVVRAGEVVLLKGYGLADVEHGVPNTAATRFEMNSMTKMFTGVAVLQLAAEHRLRLDDSADRHLGAFPPGKRGATVRQLATHTSGLIVEGADLAGDSRDAFVRDVKRTPRESAPGERYRYTNAGFSLLAAIIETVSGERYEDYLRRHQFVPAGMRTATFRNEVPNDDARFAHGYVGTPASLEPGPPNPYVWGTRGAGGVWATVGDMYLWLVALDARRVLADAQWRLLTTPPVPPAQEAFGWHVETTPEGRPRFQKGGGSDDFASHLLYYPRERVAIVWTSNNLRQRWRRTLNKVLPAIVFAENPSSPPPVEAIAPAALDARQGSYVSGQDVLELHAGPGYLYAGENRLEVPTSLMFFPQDGNRFTAFDPSSMAVTGMEFSRERFVALEFPDGRRLSLEREGSAAR